MVEDRRLVLKVMFDQLDLDFLYFDLVQLTQKDWGVTERFEVYLNVDF